MYILVNESDIRSKAVRERYHERMPDGRLILTPQELKMAGSLNCEIVSTARELKAMIEEQRKNPLLPDQGEAHPDPPKGGSEEADGPDGANGPNEPNTPNGTDGGDTDEGDAAGDTNDGDTDEGDAAGGTEGGADADNADVDGGEEAEDMAGGSGSDDNDGGSVSTAAAKQRRTR